MACTLFYTSHYPSQSWIIVLSDMEIKRISKSRRTKSKYKDQFSRILMLSAKCCLFHSGLIPMPPYKTMISLYSRTKQTKYTSLPWCHNGCDVISNQQRPDCLLNHLFRHRSKKTSKLHISGLCEGNPLVTGGFPSQRASNVEKFPFDDVIMILMTMLNAHTL